MRDTGGEGEKGEGEALSDLHFWWWVAVAGAAPAMSISYATNRHIGWAIVHGMCGWFYVLYSLLGYGR